MGFILLDELGRVPGLCSGHVRTMLLCDCSELLHGLCHAEWGIRSWDFGVGMAGTCLDWRVRFGVDHSGLRPRRYTPEVPLGLIGRPPAPLRFLLATIP